MIFQLKSFYRYHVRGRIAYQAAKKALSTDEVPTLIYSMGKVGSLSIYHSLKEQLETPVFHLHTLKSEQIDWAYKACRKKGWWPDSKSPGDLIYKRKILLEKPIKIITTVREPIERNISAFFEVFRYYNGMDAINFRGSKEALQQQFLDAVPHELPLNWLDEELEACLGIDVYQSKFNYLKKCQSYRKGNTQLLLMRVDLPDHEKEKQIKRLLDLSAFTLKNTNIGAQKNYAALYASFKKRVDLPKAYLEQMLDSAYCQHFYSLKERKELYLKWS